MSIPILKKGISDRLQGPGKYGQQHLGIQPSTAQDALSANLANFIVQNPMFSPLYELHFPASAFQFDAPMFIGISGGNFVPVLNQKSIPMNYPIYVQAGDILHFLKPIEGRTAYLAFNKNIDPHYHPKGIPENGAQKKLVELVQERVFKPAPIRFIPGPAWKDLSQVSTQTILSKPFEITTNANRMGFPLTGPLLSCTINKTYLSSAVTKGTMQLLPSGNLVVLMGDHQTIGGYANLGQIILVDLPRFAQLKNNTPFHFSITDIETAHQSYQKTSTWFKH